MESSNNFPQFSSFGSSKEKRRSRDPGYKDDSTARGIGKRRREGEEKRRKPYHQDKLSGRHRTHHRRNEKEPIRSNDRYPRNTPRAESEAQAFLSGIALGVKNSYASAIPGMFEYDMVGDENNIKYGKPHKPSVPKYYRFTSRVLGLPVNWRIKYSKEDLANSDIVITKVKHEMAPILWQGNTSFISKRPVKLLSEEGNNDIAEELLYEVGDEKADLETFENKYLQSLLKGRTDLYSKLNRNLSNIDLWFKVLKYEEAILRYSKTSKSNADDVIGSVLSRALKCNPGNSRLIRRYMMIQKFQINQAGKWSEFALDSPDVPEYWLSWVESSLENSPASSGGVLEVIYYLINQGILDILEGKYHNGQLSREKMEDIYTQILQKICHFLMEAGYPEMAVATYQSMIEVNFFSPFENSDLECTLNSFEQYWNMETAHIGDGGAVGWLNTKETTLVLKSNIYPFPARSVDLPDNDEEYNQFIIHRIVLFKDIKPLIRILTTKTGKTNLLWGLMDLLGAPKLSWPHVNESILLDSVNNEEDDNPQSKNLFCARVISQVVKQLSLKSSLEVVEDKFWGWALQFMAGYSTKHFDKISKVILSADKQNLALWTEYAFIQFDSDKTLARAVFERSLDDFAASGFNSCLNCWNHWAVKEFQVDGDLDKLTNIISRIVLKYHSKNAQSWLHDIEFSLSVGVSRVFIDYLNSDKLTQGWILEKSLKQFWNSITTSGSAVDSFTNQAIITCLRHHKRNNSLAHTSIIYEFMTKSVLQRTNDTPPDYNLFKSLAEVENTYGSTLKISISSFSSKNDKTRQILWLLYGLLQNKLNLTVRSTRLLFEQAIDRDSEARKCSVVWLMYYNFELQSASKDGGDPTFNRARSILARGLEQCGWSSNLYSKCLKEPIKSVIGPLTQNQLSEIVSQRLIRLKE